MNTVIPLTSVFTPPASCSSSWTYEGEYYNSVTGGLLIQNAFNKRDTNCFPPLFEGTGRGQIQQVFSPGYCPDGYTSPAATTNNGVTTAVCCPSDYSYFSTLTTVNHFSQVTVFAGCISTFPESSITTVLARGGVEKLEQSAVTGPIAMWGQAILVQFRSEDLSLFISASTTSSTTSSLSRTPNNDQPSPTSPPAALPPPSDDNNQSPGLSPGAKAGVAIGAVSAVALLIALMLFIRRSRRRSRRNNNLSINPHPYAIQELDNGTQSGIWPAESQSNPIHEMPAS
ncbi:hypothetical protein EMCG_06522 [[Emmonsia] crescens]|uniref:Uncharacterized protein n=1 Tax=[Emmonsia] crescens TaxID=73230 RepID=A0A0G2IAU9_9EURO|nr:hypothetical protein EMCG_06522 [Emmonsia crescens UAMH 3008]